MAVGEKTGRNSVRIQPIKFEDLLSKYPPGKMHAIRNLGISRSPTSAPILNKPRLKLYCPADFCRDVRFFDAYQTQKVALTEKWSRLFLHYSCSNCRSRSKIFAIMARWNAVADEGEAVIIGEWPPFGLQVSARMAPIAGPQTLLINGYNPLALLEQALTKGSSVERDHDALKLAAAVRKILTELAERMARALEDQTDLEEAVNTIMQYD
ncbi:MAG: hypothetical protein P8X68_11315 [Desulfobacterales bacterium]